MENGNIPPQYPPINQPNNGGDYFRSVGAPYGQTFNDYNRGNLGNWNDQGQGRFPAYGGVYQDEFGRNSDGKPMNMGHPQMNTYSYEVGGHRYSVPLDYDPYTLFSGNEMSGQMPVIKTEPDLYGNPAFMPRSDNTFTPNSTENSIPISSSHHVTGMNTAGNSNIVNYSSNAGSVNMVNKMENISPVGKVGSFGNSLNRFESTGSIDRINTSGDLNTADNLSYQSESLNEAEKIAPQSNALNEAASLSAQSEGKIVDSSPVPFKPVKEEVVAPVQLEPDDKTNKISVESNSVKVDNLQSQSKSIEEIEKKEVNTNLYSCNMCDKQYSTQKSLKRHTAIHSGERPHECEICGKAFAIRTYLTTHLKTHMKESFYCSFCDKRFPSQSSLKKHMPVHAVDRMLNLEKSQEDTGDDADISEDIEAVVGQKRSLESTEDGAPDKRRKTEETSNDDSFEQDEEFRQTDAYIQSCVASEDSKFKDLNQIRDEDTSVLNETNVVSGEEDVNEMYIKTDNEKIKLNKRVEMGANGNEMFIRTEIIEDGLRLGGGEIEDEIQIKKEPESDDEESVKAQAGEKGPGEIQIKKEPESEEEGGDDEGEEDDEDEEGTGSEESGDSDDETEQIMPCGFCTETFSDPRELLIHLEMHRDTNTYSYEVDGEIVSASFTDANTTDTMTTSTARIGKANDDQLKTTATIDPLTGEKVYKCHLCPKEYSRSNSLKRHLILHTGEKPHQCPHCERKFALVSYLTEHVKTHTGGLPFKCKVCHKQFNRLANMKVHMGVHIKEKLNPTPLLPGLLPGALPGIATGSTPNSIAGNTPAATALPKNADSFLTSSNVLNSAIELANKSGKPNNAILLINSTGTSQNNAILVKNNAITVQAKSPGSISNTSSTSNISPSNKSLISLKQQIIDNAVKQLDVKKQRSQKKNKDESRKSKKKKTTDLPIDTEEINLFKPYLSNYLGEGENRTDKQQDEEKQNADQSTDIIQTKTGIDDTENVDQEKKETLKEEKENDEINTLQTDKEEMEPVSKAGEPVSEESPAPGVSNSQLNTSLDITAQIMDIINMRPGDAKQAEEKTPLETESKTDQTEADITTDTIIKEEEPEEISEKNESSEASKQTLYSYVLEGKTYQIPLETYTSLINLDRRLEAEGATNEVLIQSYGIKPQTDAETGRKVYTCELCNKSYSRSNSLRRHLLVHTGEKAYACDLCDKKFSIKSYLTAHRKIHSGETPFGCTLCFKQFNRVSNLRAHMLVHTGLKPHPCLVCGKLFNLSSNLKRHMTIHTGLKPHVCSVCGKEFGLSSSLKEHMRVHTGENPYKCETCGKVFKQHSNFRRHKTIHTGEKKHVCYICSKSFNQSSSLKRHLTIHPETAGDLDFDIASPKMEEGVFPGEGEVVDGDKKELSDGVGFESQDNVSETIDRIVESHTAEVNSSTEADAISEIIPNDSTSIKTNNAADIGNGNPPSEIEINTHNSEHEKKYPLSESADQSGNKNSYDNTKVPIESEVAASSSIHSRDTTSDITQAHTGAGMIKEKTAKRPVKNGNATPSGKIKGVPRKVASSSNLNIAGGGKRKGTPHKVASANDLSIYDAGKLNTDTSDNTASVKFSSKPYEASDFVSDTINHMIDSDTFGDKKAAVSSAMPRFPNPPQFINPGIGSLEKLSLRMDIPIQGDISRFSDPRFLMQGNTDRNLLSPANQDFMPPMNDIPVSQTAECPPQSGTPNTLSKEDQIKQMEWYHKNFNS